MATDLRRPDTVEPPGGISHAEARSRAATHLGGGLWNGIVTTAAVLAGLGAAAPVTRSYVVLLLLLVVTALAYDAWWGAGRDSAERLAHQTTARCAVAGAVASGFAYWTPGFVDQWVAASGAVLASGIVLAEPAIARAAAYRVTFVSNLPGLAAAPRRLAIGDLAFGTNLAALATGAVLAGVGVPGRWWLVLVVLAAVPDLLIGLNAVARVRAGRAIEAQMKRAVAAYAPDFVVYTAWPEDGTHQVTMWLPYLRRTGKRFIIVTRHNFPAERLAEHTDAPIVMRHGSRDLDDVIAPSLTTAFYVNASSGNNTFVRYHHLTHVFLGHGDSDKPTSYNPTHAMYDRLFAAGPAAVRRYADHGVHIPEDKFDIVGRPQVEAVEQSDGPVGTGRPVVLYAPTWRGHVEETKFDSLPLGESIVRALLERGATVIFRPHPFSYTFDEDAAVIGRIQDLLAADAPRTGRDHRWGADAESALSVLDCINASDALVSDVSSVVSDFLFSGKPFAMVAMSEPAAEFVASYPISAASYVIESDLSNLTGSLEHMLGDDPLAHRRLEVRSDYLGDFPPRAGGTPTGDGYAERFVDTARRIIETSAHEGAEVEAERETDEGVGRVSLAAIRQEMAVVARDVIAGGLATLTLGLVIAPGARWAAASGALLTLVLIAVLHRRARWGNDAFASIAGSFRPARVLLLLALGLGWSTWHSWSWTLVLGVLLVVFVTAAESAVAEAWARVGLEARHLPALRTDVVERVPRGVLGSLGTVAVGFAWLVGELGDLGSVVLAAGVILAALFAVALANGTRRVYRCVAAEESLKPTLEAYAPDFAVYFGSNVGAAYQIGMWMPFFERIGHPFLVVMRNLGQMRAVEHLTDAPLVHRPTLRSLEDVVVPSLSTAFYVNNATNNTHFIERRQMVHVWLNHGDSEKAACYNPVHAIYDVIFAAGRAGIDRYARHGVQIPERKFEIVGRPQVEGIARADRPIADVAHPTVLYAPTWRGPYADTEVYSLRHGPQIVQALLDRGATVIFRSHEFNYRFADSSRLIARIGAMLDADGARTGRDHRWGARAEKQMSLVDCFNASDAMVADVSAVVSDYLQSGKPLSIVSVGRTPEQLRAEAPAATAAYVVAGDLHNLDSALDDLLGADSLARERDRTRVYYLGDFPDDGYAEGFLEASRRLIDAGPRT